MLEIAIRDLELSGYVLDEKGQKRAIIVKGISRHDKQTLIIFAFTSNRYSDYTAKLTKGQTTCLSGSFWSVESFEHSMQVYEKTKRR